MTSKREQFHSEVERLNPYYRRFATDRLLEIVQTSGSLKPNVAAAKAVLDERETPDENSN